MSARITAWAATGARARASRWSRLRSIQGRFRPWASVLISEQCRTVSAISGPNCAPDLIEGGVGVLDDVVQEPGDHDALVETEPVEDQGHAHHVLDVRHLAAAPDLAMVADRRPAEGLLQLDRHHGGSSHHGPSFVGRVKRINLLR